MISLALGMEMLYVTRRSEGVVHFYRILDKPMITLQRNCDVFRAFYRSILTTVFHHLTPFSFQSIYVHVISLPPFPLNKETLISLLKLTSPFRPPLEKTFPMYLRATYNRYEFPLQFIIPLSFVHFRSNIFFFF